MTDEGTPRGAQREMRSDELVEAMENLYQYPRLIAERAYAEGLAAGVLAPTPPDALDPHRGETAWTRGHGQGDWCRVHGVIDRHTSVKQHILDQHPYIDYDQHLETAIANAAPTPPDALREAAQAIVDAWRRIDYVVYSDYEGDEEALLAAGLTLDSPMDALRAALAKPKETDRE